MSINIHSVNAGFVREPLKIPFGFKGGYLTELWQTIVQLADNGHQGYGVATQSPLYGDATLFALHTEEECNAMMFSLTKRALHLVKKMPFHSPLQLFGELYPLLDEEAAGLTGKPDLNPNFVLNAMVAVDNAAWTLYAAENGISDFFQLLPPAFQPAFAARNDRIGILFQVSYDMPLAQIVEAVENGYFLIKIKTGQPGTQQEMLEKDKQRISAIHTALQHKHIKSAPGQMIHYTLDCNGRYQNCEILEQLLAHIEKIGALANLLLVEEPFPETNQESVTHLPVRIAADESANSVAGVRKRISQGYGAIVLKAIAKTLSLTVAIAAEAKKAAVPCFCSDLTVNPFLLNWHKNVAARLDPFPGVGMPMMETNGRENYRNWDAMQQWLPFADAGWQNPVNGTFVLDNTFYRSGAGIFAKLEWYDRVLAPK